MRTDEFWKGFLAASGKDESLSYRECFHFCSEEKLANNLLRLVLEGKKCATSSSLLSYQAQGDEIPAVGDYSIVTDWDNNPHCVIETTAVTIIPFGEMTYEICSREGEDDTLLSWQQGHRKFFALEGEECGFEFNDAMPVVFEDFRVVYTGKEASVLL